MDGSRGAREQRETPNVRAKYRSMRWANRIEGVSEPGDVYWYSTDTEPSPANGHQPAATCSSPAPGRRRRPVGPDGRPSLQASLVLRIPYGIAMHAGSVPRLRALRDVIAPRARRCAGRLAIAGPPTVDGVGRRGPSIGPSRHRPPPPPPSGCRGRRGGVATGGRPVGPARAAPRCRTLARRLFPALATTASPPRDRPGPRARCRVLLARTGECIAAASRSHPRADRPASSC